MIRRHDLPFRRSAVVAALVAALVGFAPFGAANATTTSRVQHLTLPAGLDFQQLFIDSNLLTLTGKASAAGDSDVSCVLAYVDPVRLTLGSVNEPECIDPQLQGASVAPFEAYNGINATAYVAHVDANGRTKLGPAIASYPEDSTSHLEWTEGPGSLWLYETQTQHGAMVFRVSSTTGRLLQATPVPNLARPLLAANANGLYIAAAGSFGENNDTLIYFVAPGRAAQPVVNTSGSNSIVTWVVGSGNRLWADVCVRPLGSSCTIVGYAGPTLQPLFHVSDGGTTANWVAGNPQVGFYSFVDQPGQELDLPTVSASVIRIDPNTGATTTVATVMSPPFFNGNTDYGSQTVLVLGGYLYYLVENNSANPATLYKVKI